MKEGTIQHESGLHIWEGMHPNGEHYWLQMYYPRAKNPFCNAAFLSPEQREEYKQKQIKAFYELLELRKKRRDERKTTPEKLSVLKIGDIFNNSWGYDQTNQDYYQLIELKGTVGIFRELSQERESTGFMQGRCKPIKDEFIGEPFRKKIQFLGNKPFINMGVGFCDLWDGRDNYFSTYA